MSYRIDLIQNDDLAQMGHIFCSDCATELNVVLVRFQGYLHPRYDPEWDAPWSEWHNIRHIYPELLKIIWDDDFFTACPNCGNADNKRLKPLDCSMFDLRLIARSLKAEEHVCICTHCAGSYAKSCMVQRKQGYVCGDCAAYAEK